VNTLSTRALDKAAVRIRASTPLSNATRAPLNVQRRAEGKEWGVFLSISPLSLPGRFLTLRPSTTRHTQDIQPPQLKPQAPALQAPPPHHQHHEDLEREYIRPTTLRNIARYVRSMTTVVTMIDYQIPAGGYIKRSNSPPLYHRALDSTTSLSTRLYTLYIYHHHGLVRQRPRAHRGSQTSELVLCDVCCVVLIATRSSTNPPPSTSLTSLMSSLLVLLPMRFDPVVLSFSAIFNHALGCQGI
jgi:hypothetical protein